MNFKKIGSNIRKQRIQAGLSQKELSKMSRISQGSLSRIENGGDMTVLQLYRLHAALKSGKNLADWLGNLSR